MKRAWIIALREVRTYLQDKADLAFSLLLPVATFALIYGAFGGTGLFHATASVVNEDPGGVYSARLIDDIKADKSLTLELLTLAEAQQRLDRSDLSLVFVIPKGFSKTLYAGQPAEVIFMQRGNGGQAGQIVASIIRGAVARLNQDFSVSGQVEKLLTGQSIPTAQIVTTTRSFLDRERQSPLVGVTEVSLGQKPNLVNEFLPGIITMYVLFSISISAAAIVDERKKGTLERLLTTRLTIGELFFGKWLASVSRGCVQIFVLLALSYAVFRIFTPLTFIECFAVSLLFSMAASAIGLLIASVARTQDAATWIGVFITMAMTMLGGTFFTISKGSVLYALSKVSLNTYANDAFKTLITGGSAGTIWLGLGVMAGVTIAGMVVSRHLFKALPSGK